MTRRVYDLEQLHGLLRKDDAKIAPPEFRQPLNVEYEVDLPAPLYALTCTP